MGNIRITKGILELERRNGRVIMGYLLGFAIMAYWANNFLRYAADTGEPINILETFCVVEQHHVNLLFLILGWLFVVADAPFINENTYLLLYRCGRKRWNLGMISYVLLQALLYTTAMAAFTAVISSFTGYIGSIWSSPLYSLAMDVGTNIGAKYNISFAPMMMKTMTVPQAFAVTFLFLYLYLAFLGVLLYVCNLLFSGIAGLVIVMGVHLLGYLQMMDGHTDLSLLARAVPCSLMDGTGRFWRSAALFSALIGALAMLSALMIKKVDFKAGAEGISDA